jgi:hypothetical protein
MVGAAGNAISSVVQTIRDHLPFSPAKTGPLRVNPPDIAGQRIVEMLIGGLLSRQSSLGDAVAQLLQQLGFGNDLSNAVTAAVGAGRTGLDTNSLTDAFAAAINSAELVAKGSDLTMVVNRGNRDLARRQ